jgi:hypothetical protein
MPSPVFMTVSSTGPRRFSPISSPISSLTVALAFTLAVVGTAHAAPIFTPGNLVVSLVGNVDGSGPYTDNQASPIKLQELTTTGAPGNSIVLSQTTTVANGRTQYAVSGEYGSSSEGLLHLAADGHSLVLAGYGVNAATFNTGGAAVYGDTRLAQSTSVPGGPFTPVSRVIVDVSVSGAIDSSTALLNVFNTNNPRSVATVNGTSFYIAGQGASKTDTATQGVFYAQLGASSATQINGSTDFRSVSIQNGQLYASRDNNGASGAQNTEIDRFATAQPTSASTPTALPGIGPTITLTASSENGVNNSRLGTTVYLSPEDYFFTSNGTNQFLYVADSGNPKNGNAGKAQLGDGGLQKWELVNGTWMLLYDISTGLNLTTDTGTSGTTGLIGLTGQVINGTTYLYATNATIGDLDQTYVFSVSDPLAQTSLAQAAGSDVFAKIFTAPAGTNVRGIAFAPVPEPQSVALVAIGLLGLAVARRRRAKELHI